MSDFGKKQSSRVFFKLRKEEGENGTFAFWTSKRDESGKWVLNENFDFLRGEIIDAKITFFKTKKGEQPQLVVVLKGESTEMQFEANFNTPVRSFLNNLFYLAINDEPIKGAFLEIETYVTKDEGYPKLKVRFNQSDEKPQWAFDLDEIPAVVSHKNSKGVVIGVDDTECNEFFVEKFNELIKPEFA